MSARRKPAHQPAPSLIAGDLPLNRLRILVPRLPYVPPDQPHQMRIPGAAPAGLVRRQQHFGSHQSSQPDVLHDVHVVTDQDARPEAMGSVKDGILAPAFDSFVLERVQDGGVGERRTVAPDVLHTCGAIETVLRAEEFFGMSPGLMWYWH